ncbi:anti-phage deoxyguanosine triphosphatase [Rhizorhabdus sp. FW153]|uniref:anti-phage deoxyguanosine triphosphatase n=1 Tax=Rhizorhabdus sp. FW153 TaxID=3400216 RepID=UPI003CF2736E
MEQEIGHELALALTYRAPLFDAPKADAGVGKEAFVSDTREPYQRDLGRIIHSASFRRLQTKTQVMGTGEGDFHRTRLTHSLEVGQIGRGIVWNLASRKSAFYADVLPSSELIEAVCYAHDLGHPPYGHGGERALHSQMLDFGGFEGNAQTVRIITHLEKYYRGEGIRCTRRLLLGILKYPVAYSEYGDAAKSPKPPKCFYDEDLPLIEKALSIFSVADRKEFRRLGEKGKPLYKAFDCSIMELADDIAYGVHDLEDGIGRNILDKQEAGKGIEEGFRKAGVDKVRNVAVSDLVDKLFSGDACERKHAISLLVGYFIMEIQVRRQGVFESPLLDLNAYVPPATRALLDHLARDITYDGIVKRREVQTLEYKGEKIISDLFRAFAERPSSLVGMKALDPSNDEISNVFRGFERDKKPEKSWMDLDDPLRSSIARAICDFIAGMTNPYAEKYHRRLFEPGYGSATDEL